MNNEISNIKLKETAEEEILDNFSGGPPQPLTGRLKELGDGHIWSKNKMVET